MAGDHEFPVPWIVLCYVVGSFNFLASTSCLFVLQALIWNSSIRKNSYNIYVIFLIFPDALQNIFTGLWEFFWKRPMPQGFHEINSFVWFFYFTSNFYLNAVVAYEINKLATASHRRQKTSPPELGRVWRQVTLVCLFASVISLWITLPYNWTLMDVADGPNGIVKFGSPNGGVFDPMVAKLILFATIAIPITYVLCIRIRIAWYKLLPQRGRTRILSLFFMRIIIVFLLFYLPNTILNSALVAVGEYPVAYFWIANVSIPLLDAFQALVTLYMVLWKDDIREAVANSWNGSFGKCCFRMDTPVQRRSSAVNLSLATSRLWGDSNGNPSSLNPPSLSTSYLTEPTLPKKSEWDEEDLYSDRHPDQDPKGSEESGSNEVPEDSSNACQDVEMPPNCRDCTDSWVRGQASGEDT